MHSNKFMYAASSCIAANGGPASSFNNTCMKLLTLTHFRYDPYNASVIPTEFITQSPVKLNSMMMHSSIVALSVSPSSAACEPVTLSSIPSSTYLPDVMPSVQLHIPAPRSAMISPAPSVHSVRYAVIKFKQETTTFIAPFRIVVGDTVVVEGDRGENVGIVQEITQVQPSFEVTKNIIRRATDKDLATLQAQREREQAALDFTQSLASTLGLHATIEDVEYQFDLNKLTIFVRRSAKGGFVDFRKLQRSLFREFRCRIWCAYMDEVEAIENGPRSR